MRKVGRKGSSGRKTKWKKEPDKTEGTGTLAYVLDKELQLVTNFPGFAQSSFR